MNTVMILVCSGSGTALVLEAFRNYLQTGIWSFHMNMADIGIGVIGLGAWIALLFLQLVDLE